MKCRKTLNILDTFYFIQRHWLAPNISLNVVAPQYCQKRNLVIVVIGRLIVIPALVLGTAYYMGFRGVDFVTLLCIFATPCAVASFAMAQQLGSNAELAGNSVVLTSAFSSVTLFFWVMLFQVLGVF